MISAWVNGQPASSLNILDRGLGYGDGLFETIRIDAKGMTLQEQHIARLESSARTLGLTFDPAQLITEITAFLVQNPVTSGVLKVIISRGVGGRGYNPAGCDDCNRVLALFAFPDFPEANTSAGINLFDCSTPLGLSPALAGMKHLNRLEQVLARSEWQSMDFAEGLMCDLNCQVIEGTMSNLFMVEANTLVTPALTMSGVAGVCRQFIIDKAQQSGMSVEVRPVSREQLFDATEVFVCNSVFGVWPVIRWKDRHWPIGTFTREAQSWIQRELDR